MTALLLVLAACLPASEPAITLPYDARAWKPDGADAVWAQPAVDNLETNGHYIRRPSSASERRAWKAALDHLRREAERPASARTMAVRYRGVRAWIRLNPTVGAALHLQAGEVVRVTMEARRISGNPEVCGAFDFLDRQNAQWKGWSTVLATARLSEDGSWQRVALELRVPEHGPDVWPNVIVGQDATRSPSPSRWEVRSLTIEVPERAARRKALARAIKAFENMPPLRAIYDRPDLQWASANFTCYFLFLYDREAYDIEARRYRIPEMLARWQTQFGGADSVVLWQAYPRIGVDDRNQFDFYRDMPGGLRGLRGAVNDLHAHGVRVFLAYNPWDTSTRREGVDDTEAIARMVTALDADGVFLDTMSESPAGLRKRVDRARRGVVFEPEGSPPVDELGSCSSSWAQWLAEYPEPAIPLLKWIEPRHMQHYIRRWDRSHSDEIRSAFLGGNGMLVWENVFGTWNPWSADDAALWRTLSPILRRFGTALRSTAWEPFVGTLEDGTTVHRWPLDGADLYLFWAASSVVPTPKALGIPLGGYGGEDLVARTRIADSRARLRTLQGLGAVVMLNRADPTLPPPVELHPVVPVEAEAPHPVVKSAANRQGAAGNQTNAGMVYLPGGVVRMHLQHERRECGCIPDPGSPPELAKRWAWGDPFSEIITHDYSVSVKPFWIDECPVTNAEFEAFIRATGYRPAEPRNFLKHWRGRRCPPSLRDHPVVYVDLDDARAYARWAGKRLPSEAEWQLAAQGTDGRMWPWGDAFDASRCNTGDKGTTPVRAFPQGRSPFGCYDMTGNVWQWTESETSDGHTRSCIIRGGSWFDAKGSIWYVHGGPQPLNTHTRFLMLYPGLDRCATIGFRCVRDAVP